MRCVCMTLSNTTHMILSTVVVCIVGWQSHALQTTSCLILRMRAKRRIFFASTVCAIQRWKSMKHVNLVRLWAYRAFRWAICCRRSQNSNDRCARDAGKPCWWPRALKCWMLIKNAFSRRCQTTSSISTDMKVNCAIVQTFGHCICSSVVLGDQENPSWFKPLKNR